MEVKKYVRISFKPTTMAESRQKSGQKGFRINSIDVSGTRDSHLHTIAAFSQFAAAAGEPRPVLHEAVRVATAALGIECAILLRLSNDSHVLRAGLGWNEDVGLAGTTQVNIGTSGVLTVRTAPGSLREDELDFLQAMANVVALVIGSDAAGLAPPQEHEILQTIFDHAPVMISFRGTTGELLYVNRAWEQTLGWALEEARETDFFKILYPDPKAWRDVMDFMDRCERRWTDFRLRTREGRILDTSWARFRLSDGSSIGFGIDITARKQTEKALADLQTRFVKVFEACPVPLAISTVVDGRIVDVNDSWLQMYGYARDEVIGRTNAELHLSIDPGARAETIRQIRSSGLVRSVEVQVRVKSGEIRDVIASAVSVALTGEEELLLSSQVDVTDWKRAESERDRLLGREQAARAEAETALERLRAIESITDTALQNLGLDELLQKLLARVGEALNADFASVALIDEQRQELYLRAVAGPPEGINRSIRSPLGEGVSGKIALDGQPRIVNDLAAVDLSHVIGMTPEQIVARSRSVVGAPLQVGGKIVGVVTAAAPEPDHFNEDDLKLLLVVADRVAPAIERARLVETVHAGRERLKALSASLLTAQEEERRRVAVELHDELGQVLTAVKINLQSVGRKLDASFRSDLADAVASVDEAMERVRDLALDLRPAVLDDLGLPTALRWYTHRFARDTGIDVHFSADSVPRFEAALETACFRIAQEALTNVMRHAHAQHVWVDLKAGTGETELKICDDGLGFDVITARERAVGGVSVGLLGMEERVSSLGGAFEVRSVQGHGTRLSVRFPLPARL